MVHDLCGAASVFVTTLSLAPPSKFQTRCKGENKSVLWALFVILLLMWFAGVVSSYTLGGLIHFLLALAVIALIFQLRSGGRSAA